MNRQSLYGAFSEGEPLHANDLLSGRSLGYSAAVADGYSEGMTFWDTKGNFRSKSGPEGNIVVISWGYYGGSAEKEKAEEWSPALGVYIPTLLREE
jgi:hypothetical protein